MRYTLIIFIFISSSSISVAQSNLKIKGDTLIAGTYDTVRIELESRISFPFCSEIYQLPQGCNINLAPNCCRYRTSPYRNEKIITNGSVSCSNGSNLSWNYFRTLEDAKFNFESIPNQWEKQNKTVKKIKLNCLILNKEAYAYLIDSENLNGNHSYVLLAYGTHKGYNFLLEFITLKKIESNEDIQSFLYPIIKLKE